MPRLVVQNRSTRVSQADAKAMSDACDSQMYWQVAPVWGRVPIRVVFTAPDAPLAPDDWLVTILDVSDQAPDVLGYHSENNQGIPDGFVFVNPVLDHGGTILDSPLSVASTLSHEVMEAAIDFSANLWADHGDQKGAVALEVGDPFEGDSYDIFKGKGIYMSNFAFPSWFDPAGKAPFDQMRIGTAPFTLAKGGYMVSIGMDGNPQQTFGAERPDWRSESKDSPYSRTSRRMKKAAL